MREDSHAATAALTVASFGERDAIVALGDALVENAQIFGNGCDSALAEARDGQCRGCGMRILPHILQQLLQDANDDLFRCESCGLILYSLEPIPAPNPDAASGSTASSASSSS